MAGAAAVHRCCFEWNIFNPFLPCRNLEATFSHESPTITQWKMTLVTMDKSINCWKFSFSLESLELLCPRLGFVANSVLVRIYLNGELIKENKASKPYFDSSNRFKNSFKGSAVRHPQMEPHHLVIKIEISLSDRATGNEVGNRLFSDDEYLKDLSFDLSLLRINPQYSNMSLWSSDRRRSFRAHSYIMDARWDNFFREHAFVVGFQDAVETNISDVLLLDILTYMYSGTTRINWPHWGTPAYIAELFKVINRYELYHLYNVFAKNDFQHVRETRNPGIIESCLFPLDFVVDRPITTAPHTWNVDSDPEYRIIFQIRVWNEAGNWLSYSLQSISTFRVYCQVNLELMKRVEGGALRSVFHAHEKDCTIDPEATVESGPVLFLGCPETFGDYDGTKIKYFIRCFLNVTNGSAVHQVQSEHGDTLPNDLEKFAVFGDHMHKLNERRFDADMRIISRRPEFSFEDTIEDRIHKGILAVRIPDWWAGLSNQNPENTIPDVARSTLGSETLPMVLNFMYTGKTFTIPFPFHEEIQLFAVNTVFNSLNNLVIRDPSREINQ